MNHLSRHIRFGFCVALFALVSACNPAKKLKENEFLLRKNILHGSTASVDKSEIESYIRLKPNYKLLGLVRFHLWLYNMANEERIIRKRKAYDEKRKRKNERRITKGKEPKTKGRQLFGEWLLNIGEAPVVYDSFLVQKSAQQIKLYLNNKGYFLNSVKDSVKSHKQKATVYYNIELNAPYKINRISYDIKDEKIKNYVYTDTLNCLIKKGDNYDLDLIEEERERLVYLLNNEGYYLFNREFVFFKIDTFSNPGKVNIEIGIKNFLQSDVNNSDSLLETTQQQFYINNVFIQTAFSPVKTDSIVYDTLHEGKSGEYKIIYSNKLKYKTKTLLESTKFIEKDNFYRFKNVEITYRRLSELKAFKYINIYFKEIDSSKLDCYIDLSTVMKQAVTIETEGTNTSGNLGISGSIIYQNKNLFKGAEVFELKLKGGFSAQRILDDEESNKLLSNSAEFNTVEFGPELNIYIPRFLLPFKVETYRLSSPKTIFTSGLNYQQRPDYSRIITNFSLGYTWNESSKKRHIIYPFVIDFVKVDLQPKFYTLLNTEVQNKFILNSFSNHLTTSSRYSFIYNEQDFKKDKNFSFFRGNFETSGNLLRGIYTLANQIEPNTFVKDNQGRYTLLDIAYAHYLRTDVDYRYYMNLKSLGKIVFRIAGGIGKPLENFKVLPFERSFFSGGANGLRAWQARTIGPGSYFNQYFSYDRFGDGQLEGNIEHRFKIFKMLNGAVFIDAGNIWLEKPDQDRPGGEFKLNRFYKQIAIGTGLGLRADFSFFIIRLDLGIKAKDPQFPENQRWVLQHLFDNEWKQSYSVTYGTDYNFTTLNIGVGYPF